MSTAYGGNTVLDAKTAGQMLLAVALVGFGVSAILCKSLNRLAVMAVLFAIVVAHLGYLVTA